MITGQSSSHTPSNKKKKGKLSDILSSGTLVLISLFFGLCLVEVVSWYLKEKAESTPNLKTPFYFKRFKSSPHIMLKNSILYLAPANHSYRTFGLSYKTNGMGFRERNFEFKKPKNVYRILVLGDSVTFGTAVANEQRYTNILERMLEQFLKESPHKDFSKIEVLNFGVAGYATDQERDLAKTILKLVDCNLVIVGLFHNDFTITTKSRLKAYTMMAPSKTDAAFANIPAFYNPDRNWNTISNNLASTTLASSWYEKSHFYNFLNNRTNLFLKNTKPAHWDYVFNEFLEIKKITARHNLPSPLVVLLYSGFINSDKNNFQDPTGGLARIIQNLSFAGEKLKKSGFNVISPLPLFAQHSFMTLAVSEWENHPNFLAHYLYAKSIYDDLLKNNFLDNIN